MPAACFFFDGPRILSAASEFGLVTLWELGASSSFHSVASDFDDPTFSLKSWVMEILEVHLLGWFLVSDYMDAISSQDYLAVHAENRPHCFCNFSFFIGERRPPFFDDATDQNHMGHTIFYRLFAKKWYLLYVSADFSFGSLKVIHGSFFDLCFALKTHHSSFVIFSIFSVFYVFSIFKFFYLTSRDSKKLTQKI